MQAITIWAMADFVLFYIGSYSPRRVRFAGAPLSSYSTSPSPAKYCLAPARLHDQAAPALVAACMAAASMAMAYLAMAYMAMAYMAMAYMVTA